MHSFLDDSVVGLVLFASVIYAVFSLGPRTLRPHAEFRALLKPARGLAW